MDDRNTADTRFLEIEHKYVVPEGFDRDELFARATALGPLADKQLDTRDIYFMTGIAGYIYRHRLDHELQHLTVKSYGGDNQTRLEVNLQLQLDDQQDAIRAFLQPLGVTREVRIDKHVRVFEYADCEVVHYTATHAGHTINCVEVEARAATTHDGALAVIAGYERSLGLAELRRSERSLLQLFLDHDA